MRLLRAGSSVLACASQVLVGPSSGPFRKFSSHTNAPKLPDLLYFPHVMRWLKTKLKLKYLQKSWDPDFNEGAFIYGTTHAVCRITEIIHGRKPEMLVNLVTPNAKIELERIIAYDLTPLQMDMIRLAPDDIKLFVPLWVRFEGRPGKMLCKVLLKSLSMKWHSYKNSLKLVLIVIETEFQREYEQGPRSDWIINGFQIKQCSMLTGASKIQ